MFTISLIILILGLNLFNVVTDNNGTVFYKDPRVWVVFLAIIILFFFVGGGVLF